MAKKKTSKDPELVLTARQRFEAGIDYDRENRLEALDDLKFVAGEQWDDLALRLRENRPCLTINRMPGFVRQVSNEIRLKPPGISVVPVESDDQETAEVMEGMIRSIERRSKAQRIYAQAAEDSARCGMGFWRIKSEYVDDEVFDQDLCVEVISNPMSVVFDPASKELTRADAKWCFVYDDMPMDDFKEMYPGKATEGFEEYGSTTRDDKMYSWGSDKTVRVAEYWEVKEEDEQIVLLDNGETIAIDKYDEMALAYNDRLMMVRAQVEQGIDPEPIQPIPMPVVDGQTGQPKMRSVKRKKVCSYIISGKEVLSGPHYWPGKRIPIIPAWGEEVRVGERVVRSSVIRWAKDPQRMKNYWQSANVEQIALAPKAPWLVTAKQIKGFETEWADAGTGNPPYLAYNPDGQAPPPQRQAPPPIQAAMLQQTAQAEDDMKATTGIYDASLGAQSNETSGKAILARQREGDVGTYVFVDNLMAAIEETGRVLVDMIPHVYDTKRQVRILGKKEEFSVIMVNDGSQYDLTRGKYDVVVSSGTSFTTKRQEMAETFTELLRSAPMLAPVLIPRMAEVMDFPDADEVAQEIKALMQPQPQQPEQPKPPNPKDVAQARKYDAEATSVQLENVQKMASFANPYEPPPTGFISS